MCDDHQVRVWHMDDKGGVTTCILTIPLGVLIIAAMRLIN